MNIFIQRHHFQYEWLYYPHPYTHFSLLIASYQFVVEGFEFINVRIEKKPSKVLLTKWNIFCSFFFCIHVNQSLFLLKWNITFWQSLILSLLHSQFNAFSIYNKKTRYIFNLFFFSAEKDCVAFIYIKIEFHMSVYENKVATRNNRCEKKISK